LSSRHNVPIVDADLLAREVVEPGTRALRQIVKAFGSEILTEDGRLNRPALGRIIFNDAEKRKVLNKIVHPAVHRAMIWAILKLWISGHKWCVLDVPLLIEGGLWKWVAKVVLVYW
jgi:dephospho-CoA kinase